jgi:glycosyltransferase involved in cell wall biosynthesis
MKSEQNENPPTANPSSRRLLICTQSIDRDDPIAGFFYTWVCEFAKHCEKITVIALSGTGAEHLPKNVQVISLEKERHASKFRQLYLFYRAIIKYHHEYDTVFVHNVGPKLIILGAPFWRAARKKIFLWYVHRQVHIPLKLALKMVKKVFTSAPESMRVKTDKVLYVGHGIDLTRFKSITPTTTTTTTSSEPFKVIHLGRIAPIKNIDTLVETARLLQNTGAYEFHLYGTSITEAEHEYKKKIEKKIIQYGLTNTFHLHGTVSPTDVPNIFKNAAVSVNLTPTGGMDKAVIESMAAGVPTLISNEAFATSFGTDWNALHVTYRDPRSLAEKIETLRALSQDDFTTLQAAVRTKAEQFDLSHLIQNLVKEMYVI